MLRLDYLLMSSVIDQAGDKLEWEGGVWCIKSFANRDNNGMQPVPDDFPVVVCYKSLYRSDASKKAGCFKWDAVNGLEIKSWKPDYDKLLEQQNEYDKQQEKPIEEIILDAKESKMSEFEYGQEIYIEGNTKNGLEFGCNFNDGKSILYMFDGGYGRASIESVSATPFKTELEIAKEKQVSEIASDIGDYFGEMEPEGIVLLMQERGYLSEIILPLKDK